jgi:hypothetical protein
MAGTYANKEQANQWYNDLQGQMLNKIVPQTMSSGLLSYLQFMPDSIQEILRQLAERTTVGSLGAGFAGWGGMLGPGDVGDVGDFGPNGATTTAGMHPDARGRVDAMMRANPRLRVNSGFRDLGTQQRLKKKGVGRVSGKPSAHTKGMAADIGPASEYNWIVRNAKKFGLSSGASPGEPGHVGMGDPEGIGDNPITDLIGNVTSGSQAVIDELMQIFSGFGKTFVPGSSTTDQMEGIAGGTTSILKMLMAMFGGTDVNQANLAFRPDVYSTMVGSTQAALKRGITLSPTESQPAWMDLFRGRFGTPRAGSGSSSGAAPQVQLNPGALEPFKSPDRLTRGIAVVNALYAAGFRKEELAEMAAISWHESSWKYDSWVEDDDDIGGGLFGLNQKWDLDHGLTPRFTKADAQDPYISAQIARSMYLNEFPYNGPGGKNTYRPWTTRDETRAPGDEARAAAGLGDIDYGAESLMMPPVPRSQSSGGVNFYNTFSISGGGGANGGIDVRRTATLLADQLEQQMQQRMSRSN